MLSVPGASLFNSTQFIIFNLDGSLVVFPNKFVAFLISHGYYILYLYESMLTISCSPIFGGMYLSLSISSDFSPNSVYFRTSIKDFGLHETLYDAVSVYLSVFFSTESSVAYIVS